MELEFDKEIDSLLRQESRGRTITIGEFAGVHLDADEIAAFVENAVPERTRNSFVQHFAGCDPCRKTLSNAITLRADEGVEAAESLVAPGTERAAPWYKRLFLFPNLAYVMGGLVVLFAGFIGLSILNRSSSNGSFEMSKVSSNEAPAAVPYSTNSNASVSSANSAANATNSMSPANVAPDLTGQPDNASETDSAKGKGPGVPADFEDAPKMSQPLAAAPPPPASISSKDSGILTDGVDSGRARELRTEPVKELSNSEPKKLMGGVSPSTQNSQNVQIQAPGDVKGPYVQRNDSRNVERAIEQNNARDREKAKELKSVAKKSDKAAGSAAPAKPTSDRRQVSGKTFEFRSGAWYDTTYSGQGTVNIRRKTDNYKNLDRGLRGIADSFIGTVVMIWNGKAYRID